MLRRLTRACDPSRTIYIQFLHCSLSNYSPALSQEGGNHCQDTGRFRVFPETQITPNSYLYAKNKKKNKIKNNQYGTINF